MFKSGNKGLKKVIRFLDKIKFRFLVSCRELSMRISKSMRDVALVLIGVSKPSVSIRLFLLFIDLVFSFEVMFTLP